VGCIPKGIFASFARSIILYPTLKIVAPSMDLDVTPPLSDPAYAYGIDTHWYSGIARDSIML